MNKRFSSEELYKLRTDLCVRLVIESLEIPSKVAEGQFRFLCPCCNEFQTSVNSKTNLGRCFRCQRNFNTIEFVMSDRKLGFVDSVKFLKQLFGASVTPLAPLPADITHQRIPTLNIS